MAKPPDKGNSTQPLSASQVLAVSQPQKPPRTPKHDQSMWKGLVVGADEFAPQPAKSSSRGPKWVLVGLLGATVAGGGLYAAGVFGGSSSSSSTSGEPSQTPAQAPPKDEPAAKPASAVAATAPADAAAPVAAPPDAAAAEAPLKADAISSVGPLLKSKATPASKKKKPAPPTTKKRPH